MEYNIYIKNNNKLYNIYIIIFIIIFDILNIKYNYINNYDDKVDIIIKAKNNINYTLLNNKKIIINSFINSYLLMDKKLLNNYNITPYNFEIKFNKLNYDKKLMKTMIDKYNDYYNKNMGNDLWILKNSNSGQGIGTIILKKDDLLKLDQNKEFIKERNIFKENTNYTIQKYLEKPFLYNNKKGDLRVFVVVFCYKKNNKLKYKFYTYKKLLFKYSDKEYDINNLDKYIHLTNESVQNIYELKEQLNDIVNKDVYEKIYNDIQFKLKEQMTNKYFKDFYINNKLEYVYEIYGVDFLLDNDYNTYLIDFNTTISLYSTYEYFNILKQKENIIFNMLIMIILKMLKIYNKDKKFINKENKKMYKELCHTNNFKKQFDLLFYK